MKIFSKHRRVWLFLCLFFMASSAVFFGYVYATTDPAGYCRAQRRYIPDEEFIRTAIALLDWEWGKRRTMFPDNPSYGEKWTAYYQEWERVRNKPNCSFIGREEGNPVLRRVLDLYRERLAEHSIYKRLLDLQEVGVTLYTSSESPGDHQVSFTFNICGELVDSGLSPTVASHIKITTTNYLNIVMGK